MSYRKAIDRVRADLEKSPNDVRLLQKLGELFQKARDDRAAAEAFSRIATCYLRDGFQLKAVALLKQVLMLDPGLMTARETLGASLRQLGLTAEAIEQFKVLLREYALLERVEDTVRVANMLADLGAK